MAINQREIVLCVGMHRSGTSLTASLLESLGVCLPGDLIPGDAANLTGYFENRSIVAAQEQLLQNLGYWWPTEKASQGIPSTIVKKQVYVEYIDWLTNHLEELFTYKIDRIGVKDPRSSLLMPAWKEAANRLGLKLKVVICIREPRDVCWSLVWRDGPSVGMTWSRAQRLWMRHYKEIINNLGEIPTLVVRYDCWFRHDEAIKQIQALEKFVGCINTPKAGQEALRLIRPDFNHAGKINLPEVDKSLKRLYSSLTETEEDPSNLNLKIELSYNLFKLRQIKRKVWEHLKVLFLKTHWGQHSINKAFDPETLRRQIGTTSFRSYRREFRKHSDLRPHPLISPAHLNRERKRRGMKPIKSADDLFRHLLYPDLSPLNTHPWLDCREYQKQNGELGIKGPHPILNYLNQKEKDQGNNNYYPTTKYPLPWLINIGAHLNVENETYLPEIISHLHPGLILANPLEVLGKPSGDAERVIAHEKYWRNIQDLFELWQDTDLEGPLAWINKQPNADKPGLTEYNPAYGYQLWWVKGHWEAQVLAKIAGADTHRSRYFSHIEELCEEILRMKSKSTGSKQKVLIALTSPLLELIHAREIKLPREIGILNLTWPKPSQQSRWLHLISTASVVIECRAEIRAYLQAVGIKAEWPRPINIGNPPYRIDEPTLLIALEGDVAEEQLAMAATRLNANRYNAFLRLDAELQVNDPLSWLMAKSQSHGSWLWLNQLTPISDPKGHAIITWAMHHGVNLHLMSDPPTTNWWAELTK